MDTQNTEYNENINRVDPLERTVKSEKSIGTRYLLAYLLCRVQKIMEICHIFLFREYSNIGIHFYIMI